MGFCYVFHVYVLKCLKFLKTHVFFANLMPHNECSTYCTAYAATRMVDLVIRGIVHFAFTIQTQRELCLEAPNLPHTWLRKQCSTYCFHGRDQICKKHMCF